MRGGQPASEYDAVVVGAGPAGCAAILGAPAGLRLLLVDRLELPRDVICGGVLVPRLARHLAAMGLPLRDTVIAEPRRLHWSLFDWRLGRGGPLTDTAYINIARDRFDAWLLEAAVNRPGVELWDRTSFLGVRERAGAGLRVLLRRQGSESAVVCRTLVGADGARSRVRGAAGLPAADYWVAVQGEIASPGNGVDRFLAVLGEDIDFYGWVIPKDQHLVVGLGCRRSRQDPGSSLESFLGELDRRHGIGGSLLSPARARATLRFRRRRELFPGHGDILLAGEAAGIVCPWSGEGISGAVFSGSLAGAALADGRPLRAYRRGLARMLPARLFDRLAFAVMRRPWARRLVATAAPASEFKPLDAAG